MVELIRPSGPGPAGFVTSLQYDNRGRVTRVTNAESETMRFTYTSRGQLATVSDLNRPGNRGGRFV